MRTESSKESPQNCWMGAAKLYPSGKQNSLLRRGSPTFIRVIQRRCARFKAVQELYF